ncbi:hypothetical protein HMPREF0322_00116 [Desulfitobacterium hafniense DP7]|uniref:DMSO reductase, anchor subunit DmsC n=1 Tax=Desulfitobacterium hafniense DP7 TaxID=537010 RepID=G9XGQ0_DESHA|nr:DmsC/YnfH family molybdoenzyme membrane anchor subunit [Desulfitobacterium hafniense]EHL09085.1 hypothetical protein HMPREF0322_00116 [Desulfitobacterium hafniense DP7]
MKAPKSLIIFTILSGLSAGSYLFINLMALLSPQPGLLAIEKPLTIACLVFLCTGLLASAAHLGQPFRMPNALANAKSMLAQEGYWGLLLVAVLFLSSLQVLTGSEPWGWLRAAGIVVAFGLLFVTSLVYVKVKGIPAWNNSGTIFSFLISAALMGSAVGLVSLSAYPQFSDLLQITGIIALALIFLQVIAALATEIQLSTIPAGIDIPKLTGLNSLRWILGLLCPFILILLVRSDIMPPSLYLIALVSILVGEVLSRTVFFLRGVHLKSNSSLW